MRESYFTQLQKMALVIARKIQSMPQSVGDPSNLQFINQLQTLLISKEKEEKKVNMRLLAIKKGEVDVEQVTRLDADAKGN